MSLKIKLVIIMLLFLSSFSVFGDVGFWDNSSEEVRLRQLMAEMTDEQLLAQMFLLGYMGGTPSDEIMDWISRKEIGGVKIFGWNVKDLPTLAGSIRDMQSETSETSFKIPLFIVTDQEGGWVRHVRGETSETSGNMALGASRLPSDSFQTGYYIGMELRALGINMNFAPTVDVYSNPEAHVIGPRAFSDDPLLTSVLSTAYFKGMDSAGILCTAKHFPGHGAADKDSHGALPIIHADMDTLWERELLPYRYLIKEGIPGIMSGHLAFPEITGTNIPASISPIFLTEILRQKMNYSGLIITDDLMMNGVQLLSMNTAEICKAAIDAGNDIILISRTTDVQQKVWDYLSRQLVSDRAFADSVRASAERILRAKLKYLSKEDSVPLLPEPDNLKEFIPERDGQPFFFDQAFRSTTIIREEDSNGIKPQGKILLAGQLDRFFTEGKKAFPQAETFKFDYSPFYTSSVTTRRQLKDRADNYDTIIYCLANPNSEQVLKGLEGTTADIIVLSVLTPIYLKEMDWVKNALAVYGTSRESFQAGFAALTGKIIPEGQLPLDFTREIR